MSQRACCEGHISGREIRYKSGTLYTRIRISSFFEIFNFQWATDDIFENDEGANRGGYDQGRNIRLTFVSSPR